MKSLREALEFISQREWCLALVLLAVWSCARPYMGFTHDAKMYSLQVVNAATDGAYSEDLFFKYGSQDSFSLFSKLLAPVVATLGVETAFFSIYLLMLFLLVLGEVKLTRKLIPDPFAANLSLIALAALTMPYAGGGIFHVHECFLTARLPSQALVIWAFYLLICNRAFAGTLLAFVATLVHPLMGIGGLAVAVAYVIWTRFSLRLLIGLGCAALASGVVVILYRPLGERILGEISGRWYDIVRVISPHCFLSDWNPSDWKRLVLSLAVSGYAVTLLPRSAARLTQLVIGLAVGSLLVNLVGEVTSYSLLLQGQAYRALWLLQWFSVPLAVLSTFHLWRLQHWIPRVFAIGIVVVTCRTFIDCATFHTMWETALRIWLLQFVMCVAIFRFGLKRIDGMRWLVDSLIASILITELVVTLHVSRILVYLVGYSDDDPLRVFWLIANCCSGLVTIGLTCGFVVLVRHALRSRGRIAAVSAAIWLTVGIGFVAVRDHATYQARYVRGHSDLDFVRGFLGEDESENRRLIYWPVEPALIWFDLESDCYSHFCQVQGAIFSEGNSIEGQRRAMLVRRFEVALMRETEMPSARLLEFCETDEDEPAPTREDLLRLAGDEQLDWIILRHQFDDLYAATNGSVYIYDCAAIRSVAAN